MFRTLTRNVISTGLAVHVRTSARRASWVDTKRHTLASSFLAVAVIGSLMAMIYVPYIVTWPIFLDEAFGFIGLGVAAHSLGILGHETYHDSFFRSKTTNRFIGSWVFHYPILGRYSLLKEIHLRHHRFFGTELDPDRDHWGFDHGSPKHRTHLLKIITGVVFFKSVLNFASTGGKKTLTASTATSQPASKVDLFGIALLQVAICVVITVATDWWRYPLQWLLPIVTVGALVEHLRVFCEHNEGRLRVFREPSILGVLVFGRAGFRLHAVHHQAPSVPWFALGSKYETVFLRLGDKLDVSPDYMSQLRKI